MKSPRDVICVRASGPVAAARCEVLKNDSRSIATSTSYSTASDRRGTRVAATRGESRRGAQSRGALVCVDVAFVQLIARGRMCTHGASARWRRPAKASASPVKQTSVACDTSPSSQCRCGRGRSSHVSGWSELSSAWPRVTRHAAPCSRCPGSDHAIRSHRRVGEGRPTRARTPRARGPAAVRRAKLPVEEGREEALDRLAHHRDRPRPVAAGAPRRPLQRRQPRAVRVARAGPSSSQWPASTKSTSGVPPVFGVCTEASWCGRPAARARRRKGWAASPIAASAANRAARPEEDGRGRGGARAAAKG